MIWIAALLITTALDLLTTDRALRRHPLSGEAHPIMRRLFGDRPSRKQFAVYASVQAGAWITAAWWLDALWFLAVPAAAHFAAAVRNYFLERKHR